MEFIKLVQFTFKLKKRFIWKKKALMNFKYWLLLKTNPNLNFTWLHSNTIYKMSLFIEAKTVSRIICISKKWNFQLELDCRTWLYLLNLGGTKTRWQPLFFEHICCVKSVRNFTSYQDHTLLHNILYNFHLTKLFESFCKQNQKNKGNTVK